MDGTLGSQTAWMLDGSGVQITSGEQLAEIVRRGAAAGFPVAVHAIGDRANREALDAFEETRELWQPQGLRQRIEHAQLLSAGGSPPLRRARRHLLGAVLARSVGSRHGGSVLGRQDRRRLRVPVAARLGRGRSRTAATRRSRSSIRSRASAPACGARSTSGRRGIRSSALTVDQAFHATCVAPAWLARDERRRGTLLPGHAADLVVLDRDPWDDLDAEVVATMVGGRWVHNPPPW